MTITPNPANKEILLGFTDQEWNIIVELNKRQINGFRDLVIGFLKNSAISFAEQDKETIASRIATLTPAQIQSIKQVLGM